MKRAAVPTSALWLLLLGACTTPPSEPWAQGGKQPAPARGKVTLFTEHPPGTAPMAQPLTLPAAPFRPVTNERAGLKAHLEHFTTDDGLLMDDIMCGHMDSHGMLWFGTNGGGLARYDGHAFTNFTMAHGLPDNVILSLCHDRAGNLWIGTSTGGICKYDGYRFTTFNPAQAKGLGCGINAIVEAPDGALWFASRGHGVFRYANGRFNVYPVLGTSGADIVNDLAFTADGTLWAAAEEGLARCDPKATAQAGTLPFHRVTIDEDRLDDLAAIEPEADGSLWLARDHGLARLDRVEGSLALISVELPAGAAFTVNQLIRTGPGELWICTAAHGAIHYKAKAHGANGIEQITTARGLATDQVLCAVRDRRGDLWFGLRSAGIAHYRGSAFQYYRGVKPISMAEDAHGILWVGTDRGLAWFDGERMHEQRQRLGRWIYSVSIDPQGQVGFGENMADPRQQGISWLDGANYRVIRPPEGRPASDMFWTLHDRHGRLWTGGREGAMLFDAGRCTSWTTDQGLGSNIVLCLLEDRDGALWAGTDGGGISRIDSISTTTWGTAEGLPNNVVWSIAQDAGGTLWIATLAGLCRYDGRSFLVYTTKDGLPDDNVNAVAVAQGPRPSVTGILPPAGPTPGNTSAGQMLVGTLDGLAIITGWKNARGATIPCRALAGLPNDSVVKYAPVIELYNTATGYPVKDVQTAEHSILEDRHGVIWIATGSESTGLVRFDRTALDRDTLPIDVALLNVSIDNRPVCWYSLDHGQDSTTMAQQEALTFGYPMSPREREQVRVQYRGVSFNAVSPFFPLPLGLSLNYRRNRIGFSFTGIEPSHPEAVVYQWMLEGYDNTWSAPTRETTANFVNIREGQYTFQVRAKGGPGSEWSVPAMFQFTVRPPLHRTWWAYTAYVLLAIASVMFIVRRRTAVLRRQKERLEHTVAERTRELHRRKEEADRQRSRAEESEKAKERFLANMSHEIRTPMNAIMGMTGILRRNSPPPEQERYLGAIQQSSENLLVILNDILDMSKIDAGKIELEQVPFEPRKVLENVMEVLRFRAVENRLELVLDVGAEVPTTLLGDPVRLNQVVLNLAANAVKFTPQGMVKIRAHGTADPAGRPGWFMLCLEVIDTGIGIPANRLEMVFEEFTQANSDTTRKYGGTGLGLSISKRLAELQGGGIRVESELDKGSTFFVHIPFAVPNGNDTVPGTTTTATAALSDLRILLAEDNEFNVLVARDVLAEAIPGSRVEVAANGREAVELATTRDYDVILMDIQMPELGGVDATQAIRALAGPRARVPIIAMTANVMKADLDECLRSGMNAHVPKPFSKDELLTAIAAVLRP
ncbi:MAG: response regulator [Flavobacteriales bacterium]|nr:response regulator [Flavobacteriales bacterium]